MSSSFKELVGKAKEENPMPSYAAAGGSTAMTAGGFQTNATPVTIGMPPRGSQTQETVGTQQEMSSEKPVFCGNCGAKNARGTKFCGSCGAPM